MNGASDAVEMFETRNGIFDVDPQIASYYANNPEAQEEYDKAIKLKEEYKRRNSNYTDKVFRAEHPEVFNSDGGYNMNEMTGGKWGGFNTAADALEGSLNGQTEVEPNDDEAKALSAVYQIINETNINNMYVKPSSTLWG